MEKIRNLSLRNSIILYMVVSLVVCFFLGVAVTAAAEDTQKQIWKKYLEMGVRVEAEEFGVIPRVSGSEMSHRDNVLVEICDFLETWSMLILSVGGCVGGVFLFYRNKIRRPVEELARGAQMIRDNELDFAISYVNKDELGSLCVQFDRMREQLQENNRVMWKMVEEQKALRSAVAHDIRSPLAVLKGYQEMLLEFVPEDRLDKDKVQEILRAGLGQIDRINDFVETMRRLSALEERRVCCRRILLGDLGEQITQAACMMGKEMGKACSVTIWEKDQPVVVDSLLVLEVAENLISNAFRYARESIRVQLAKKENQLHLLVTDDGSGFREDQETVTKAYFHSNPQDDQSHFGLGLYLCRLYCEKHGGRLSVGNSKAGGAMVEAIFSEGKDSRETVAVE